VSKSYAVRLRCPYGDDESWIVLENRSETLEEILKTRWDFECQLHGVQREFPVEAAEKGAGVIIPGAMGPGAVVVAAAGSISKGTEVRKRASERLPWHVPVLIRGWSDARGGPFRENSLTMVVNTAGALVTLVTKVGDSDLLFLANAISREEQEVRVAYVAPEFEGKSDVGLAFKGEAPKFWSRTRHDRRIERAMPVIVHGMEPNPFTHSAQTVDISEAGARLDGMGFLAQPGAVVEVKRRWHGKARYRVVWVGGTGTEQANQVGLIRVDGEKDIFGLELTEKEAEEAGKGQRR
jgi:hypothetical protein